MRGYARQGTIYRLASALSNCKRPIQAFSLRFILCPRKQPPSRNLAKTLHSQAKWHWLLQFILLCSKRPVDADMPATAQCILAKRPTKKGCSSSPGIWLADASVRCCTRAALVTNLRVTHWLITDILQYYSGTISNSFPFLVETGSDCLYAIIKQLE